VFFISYNLITLDNISTDLDMLRSLKAGLHFGVISVKFFSNFNDNFV